MAMHIANSSGGWQTIRYIHYATEAVVLNYALNCRVQNEVEAWQPVLDQINMVSETITDTGTGTASWSIRPNGLTSIGAGNFSSTGNDFQIWCVNPGNVGQYAVYALRAGGPGITGIFEQWLPLTSAYQWSVTDQFDTSSSMNIKIKNILTEQELVDVNITLVVDV